MTEFYQTVMGRRFYEATLPELNKNIARLCDVLENISSGTEKKEKKSAMKNKGEYVGKWICTDPDCLQYGKQVSKKEFEYIECREFPDNQFVVCGMTIDLEDYSLFEVNDYVSGYYDSVLELATSVAVRHNGQTTDIQDIHNEFFRICAECIFEQQNLIEMSFTSKFDSFAEAENFVSNYLTEHA